MLITSKITYTGIPEKLHKVLRMTNFEPFSVKLSFFTAKCSAKSIVSKTQ